MRPLYPIAAILLCVASLSACGAFGSEGGDEPTEQEDTLAVAVAPVADPMPPDPAPSAPDAAEVLPGVDQTVVADDADQPPVAEPQSMEERIEVLIAAQLATQRRLDSLTVLVAPAEGAVDPATTARGSQPAEVLGEARSQVRNFGVGILWSIVIIFVFNYLVHAVAWVLDQLSERSARRRLFFKGLVPVVRIVLWLFAGYLIVRVVFQVDAQGVIAGAAALGVAIGFAAQDLLKNLFGGIILVFDQPFQVGDKIRVGETYGEVTSIGLRSTRIVTADDNLVSVPNAQVVDQQVANANAGELNCQVVTDLYLPGDVDEAKAKKIAFEAAVGSRYVYLNKPIVVLVRDELHRTVFTRVRVKAYVLDPRHEFLFESDVTERARAGFRAAGMMGRERLPLGAVAARAPTVASVEGFDDES